MSVRLPSYAGGWAASAAESEYPELWRGLVAAWIPALGPTGATLRDLSGWHRHTSLTNMEPASDWIPSSKGWTINLDGTNENISLPVAAYPGNRWTVRMMIRSPNAPDGVAPKQVIHGLQDADNTPFMFSWSHANAAYRQAWAYEFATAWNPVKYNTTLVADTWYEMVATHDGADLRIYLDGRYENGATIGTVAGPLSAFTLGSSATPANYWDGQIASCMLWHYALPPTMIDRLYGCNLFELRRRPRRISWTPARPPFFVRGRHLFAPTPPIHSAVKRPPDMPGPVTLTRMATPTKGKHLFAPTPPTHSRSLFSPATRHRHYHDGRGQYRIFNAAEYRFYRSNSAPPAEDDSPFATNATLPHEPADVYADGTWYLSVSYFNGVLDSGFLPLGLAGETYLRLDIASGTETGSPPYAPQDVRLEASAGGVVRVRGLYFQTGDDRADEWAIAYTFDGSTPAEDTPDYTADLDGEFVLSLLEYDLAAQSHGATVKVRVQVRRNDGTEESPNWVYSEGSTVLTTTADATGPTAPTGGDAWSGAMPAEQ